MVDTVTANIPAVQPREREASQRSWLAGQALRLKLRYALFALGAVMLIGGGVSYWLSGGRYVETEDSYVQGNVLDVSTDVSGLVDQILVHEGEHVAKGQELFRLDPTRFQLAVDQARANLAQTALQLKSLEADYASALRVVAVRQADLDADRATFERYAVLVTHNAVTREQDHDANTNWRRTRPRSVPARPTRSQHWRGSAAAWMCRSSKCRPTSSPPRNSARPSATSATAWSARPMRGCDASEQAAAWPGPRGRHDSVRTGRY